jgi:hypothetical protein
MGRWWSLVSGLETNLQWAMDMLHNTHSHTHTHTHLYTHTHLHTHTHIRRQIHTVCPLCCTRGARSIVCPPDQRYRKVLHETFSNLRYCFYRAYLLRFLRQESGTAVRVTSTAVNTGSCHCPIPLHYRLRRRGIVSIKKNPISYRSPVRSLDHQQSLKSIHSSISPPRTILPSPWPFSCPVAPRRFSVRYVSAS